MNVPAPDLLAAALIASLEPIDVTFRIEDGHPVAFWPSDDFGTATVCYRGRGPIHAGRHDAGDSSYASRLPPATREEAAELRAELAAHGYDFAAETYAPSSHEWLLRNRGFYIITADDAAEAGWTDENGENAEPEDCVLIHLCDDDAMFFRFHAEALAYAFPPVD